MLSIREARPATDQLEQLKPACVELIHVIAVLPQRPNGKRDLVQSLTKLLGILQEVSTKPETIGAKLAEFVFVPISHVLRISRNVPVHALELCLASISILLRTGWRNDLTSELSVQLLILFTFLANPSSAENGIPATSEELQTAAFKCMAEVLTEMSRSPRNRRLLTETANIPTVGKAVLVIVDSIAGVSSNDVRLQALGALNALISAIDDQDALASFLPRIVSSLTKSLTPSSAVRPSFRLLERGINTFSSVLLRTLNDGEVKDLPQQVSNASSEEGTKVIRTTSWLQATTSQIKIALANVLKLRSHDKKEVRHALFELCLCVLRECRVTLCDCTSMAIETLVTLAGVDGDHDQAEGNLKTFLSSDPRLGELLRESLHGLVLALPRLIQSKDDARRRQIIHQVSVTLRLLNGEQVDLKMVDDLLASNLRDSVANVLMESKGQGTISEIIPAKTDPALVLGNTRSTSFSPLRLRLKGQDDIMAELKLLLGELAKSSSALNVAQDLVSTIASGNEETQLATLWLSVNVLRDVLQYSAGIDDLLALVGSDIQTELLDELYSMALTKLTDTNSELDTKWLSQALSLEVIAMQAIRHKKEFRVELIDSLYPVLHYLGSAHSALRNHAVTCLNIIAESCGYTNASELVISNVDYIVNAVGLKLNYHDISPQAPQVLLMMMRLCGPSLLPYLDDLVASMFSALERYHGYPKLVELLFSVLSGMAEEGVKAPQLTIEAGEKKAHEVQPWRAAPMSEVMSMVKDMRTSASKEDEAHLKPTQSFPRKPWQDSSSSEVSEDQSIENEAEDEQAVGIPDPPPPAPKTFGVLLRISELTQYYLTSSSPSLRTSLLSLLQTTIPTLAKHENSFLPLINTLWPVLLPRLDDPEAYIVSDALDIIALMCTYAENFMLSRIEGAWEDLKTLHKKNFSQTSIRTGKYSPPPRGLILLQKDRANASRHSDHSQLDHYRPEKYVDAPTRLIRESLTRLFCAIAQHVMVREEMFDDILDILDQSLYREDVRKALGSRNPDAIWLRLFKQGDQSGKDTIEKFTIGMQPVGKWKFISPPSQA